MERKLYGTAILKAKQILDLLADSDNGLSLNEIANKIAVSKPTILKILTTLTYIKYVRRSEETKKYYLGTIFIKYGNKTLNSFDISKITYKYLDQLKSFTNETVNLGIVDNDKIFILQKLNGDQPINFNSKVGDTMELYSSAMGKAALATMTASQLDKYFSRNKLLPLTKYTVTDIEQLKIQLQDVYNNGYAVDNQENQEDVVCVGAAIEKYNKLFAAFSVSTPRYRLNQSLFNDFKQKILLTKKKIEQEL